MSERGLNPFANYKPPELDEIFSDDSKLEIIQLKVERIAERVKDEMLEGGHVQEFIDGRFNYQFSYDCRSLEPFIRFTSREDELEFISNAVVAGLGAAFSEVPDGIPELSMWVSHRFSDENPRIADITAGSEV